MFCNLVQKPVQRLPPRLNEIFIKSLHHSFHHKLLRQRLMGHNQVIFYDDVIFLIDREVKWCLKGIRSSSTHKKLYQHICIDKWIYKMPSSLNFHTVLIHPECLTSVRLAHFTHMNNERGMSLFQTSLQPQEVLVSSSHLKLTRVKLAPCGLMWGRTREKVERIIHRTWLEFVLRSVVPWSRPGRLCMSQ